MHAFFFYLADTISFSFPWDSQKSQKHSFAFLQSTFLDCNFFFSYIMCVFITFLFLSLFTLIVRSSLTLSVSHFSFSTQSKVSLYLTSLLFSPYWTICCYSLKFSFSVDLKSYFYRSWLSILHFFTHFNSFKNDVSLLPLLLCYIINKKINSEEYANINKHSCTNDNDNIIIIIILQKTLNGLWRKR